MSGTETVPYTVPYTVKYKAELSRVEYGVPYHKTLATEVKKEELIPLKDFVQILKKVPNYRRHILSCNWVMLERGQRGSNRVYTVYCDRKREDGNIRVIHFFHDEHANIYFDYNKWTATDIGFLFQLYILDEDNKQ